MARRVVAECDIDGKPDAVEWDISVGGDHWKVDLCPEHGDVIRDMVKHGREQPAGGFSTPGQAAELAGRGPSPSQQVAQHELAGQVREALLQLPEADREIVLMRTFEGLSYDEAAYVLEIDAAAARKRHGRALVRLHKLLTAGGLTESQI